MTSYLITLTGSFPGASGVVTIGPSVQLTDTATGENIPSTPVPYYLNSAGSFTTGELPTTDDPAIEPAGWTYTITIMLAASPPQVMSALVPSGLGATASLSQLVPVTAQPQVEPVFPYMPIPTGTVAAGDVPVATGNGAVTAWSSSSGFTTAGTGLSGSGTTISLAVPVSVADGGTGATSAGAALTSLGAASTSALTTETSRAEAAETLLAPKASPALTGTPTAPTATALTDSTQIATTAYADSAVAVETSRAETVEALKAPLASPALTGTPTAPTASPLTSSTQVATTAYTDAAVVTETVRAETAESLLLPLPIGSPTAGQVPVATGTSDASTWGGTIAMGGHKVIGLANGTVATDAAAFGQIPAALPPSGAASGDLSGTYPSPTVAKIGGTAFSLPVSVANGGTGAASQQAAINALTGAQSAGKVLRSDGTNATLSNIQASDVPTLNQSTTGTAAGLSATLAVASGGTGQTSQQAAMNALAGAQTAGDYLRGNGTNVTMSAIQAADVPTLNQNTTGTAAGLSATLAIGSGGTGQATQQAAINALTGTQSAGKVLRSDGTNATLSAIQAGDVPTLNQSTSGTAAGLSATLAVTSGGTGQTSASAAFNALSPLTTSGDTLYGGTSGAGTRLAGNTSATKNFYTQTGNGTVSAAPAWGTIASGDLPAATTGAQGAVRLDGTAGDIQPAGTQAAGSSGLAPDAQHVHPENLWFTAADLGFLAMNFDPGMCTSSTAITAGWVLLARVNIRRAITATNVSFLLGTNGSGTSTGSFAGLYSSSGTLLSGSSDIATLATSGAVKALTVPLTTPQSLSAGTSVYTAIVTNLSSTQPALSRATSIGFFNLTGSPASTARFATYSTSAQTSLPSSISTSTQFSATNSLPVWSAIS